MYYECDSKSDATLSKLGRGMLAGPLLKHHTVSVDVLCQANCDVCTPHTKAASHNQTVPETDSHISFTNKVVNPQ